MGVVPDEIERAGHEFRRIREQRILPGPPSIRPGTLSNGLAELQNQKATTAAEFARMQDDGLTATGDGLVHFARTTVDFDNQGAAAIQQLFPETPPATAEVRPPGTAERAPGERAPGTAGGR